MGAGSRLLGSVLPMVRASHAAPTLAVTSFTTALAAGAGRRSGAVAVAGAVLAGQLTVGWSNDYLDRHRDGLVGRADKPIVAGEVSASTVGTGALLAAAACVPLSLLSGRRAAAWHGVAVASALSYNLGLKRTAFSVVPYAVAFGALPGFVSLGGRLGSLPAASTMVAGALLGAGAHFVNALPDLADDAVTGVSGLPHRCGAGRSLIAGAGLLGAATVVVAARGGRGMGRAAAVLTAASGVSVVGVVAAALGDRRRLAWKGSLVSAGLTVALYLVRDHELTRRPS